MKHLTNLFNYTNLTAADIAARVESDITAAESLIDSIVTSPTSTFETIMLPLEAVYSLMTETYSTTSFLAEVGDETQREAGSAATERLDEWDIALWERSDFAAVILAYAASEEAKTLDPIRSRLLDARVVEVRRGGHGLPDESRSELGVLLRRIAELQNAFGQNIAGTHLSVIATDADLCDLPPTFIESLESGPGGFLLEITAPVVDVVKINSPVRSLRERVIRAWLSRAAAENEPVLAELLDLRRQAAAIQGYRSWSHFQTELRMAGSPERVEDFFEELLPGLLTMGALEAERMSDLLEADTGERVLQAWDIDYYNEMMRRDQYGLDSETVAAYFPLDAVLDGFFAITGEMFGIRFMEVPATGAWHPDVRRFTIDDVSGERLGAFDIDPFPRLGKYTHFGAVIMRDASRGSDGSRVEAYSTLLANFPTPNGGRPSLLPFETVKAAFHEMGHILHQSLSRAEFPSQSGSNVLMDFVEAPSQIMENLLREPAILRRFARHYQTGEPIPEAMVTGLVNSSELNAGFWWLRQIYIARVDMALHGTEPIEDVRVLCRDLWSDTLRAYPEGTFELASLGNLGGGYAAGYYGYAWSKVRGDDMWSRFVEAGVCDPTVGADYRRTILESGNSVDPNVLMREFLGRDTSNETFLRLRGLALSVAELDTGDGSPTFTA